MRISRRDVGKGLLAAGLVRGAGGEEPVAGQSGWVTVAPGVWRASVGTTEAVTPVKTRAVGVLTDALKAMAAVGPAITVPGMSVDGRGVKVRLPLAAKEEIYGFGLQFLSLEQRGKKKVMRVNADPRFDTGDSHAPVPFYVTSLGYGVLVDSARYVTFYCGEARARPEGVTDARATHNLTVDDESEVIAEVPNCRGVDVYLFARADDAGGGEAVQPVFGRRVSAAGLGAGVLVQGGGFRRTRARLRRWRRSFASGRFPAR